VDARLRAPRASYAHPRLRADAITKGEGAIAALEELWLKPNELRMETSVVRDRTVLAVRGVRNNMAKRAIKARTCRRHWSNLYGSVHVLLWRTLASLRARCFASLKCIPSLTLICHFIDGIKAGDFARAESVRFEFQPAKIGMNISSPPALYLHSSRLMNRRTF
jgi:hypothetical protein